MPMSFSLTDTTLKHNPPRMPVRLAHSFSPLRESLRPMRCSSLIGVPKVQRLSPSRHGNISSHRGGQVPQRPTLPHLRPPRPPTAPPHPQRVIITTITHATAWKRRTACGAAAAFGRRVTTAVTGAARSPQCRCGRCPASPGFPRPRARRAAPSRTRTTRATTRTVRRSRLERVTTACAWRRARRRPGLGDSRLGNRGSNSSNRRNKRWRNARTTWGRRTRSSRA